MAKISNELITGYLAILEGEKPHARKGVSVARLQFIFTELQTLRDLAKAADGYMTGDTDKYWPLMEEFLDRWKQL